jgi:hypothetical protein
MRRLPLISDLRRVSRSTLWAGLVGISIGVFLANSARSTPARAQEHQKTPQGTSVKAPIAEIMHCPLAFAGVHLLRDVPEFSKVAYHYCKPVSAEVAQCVLYDGTGPDAKLIGVEYLVSDAIYQKMPPGEKGFWHDHKYEVDKGLLKSLTQSGEDEKKALTAVRPLWGKTYHTWTTGATYPMGPPRLFWSVTGQDPFVLAPGARLPREMDMGK